MTYMWQLDELDKLITYAAHAQMSPDFQGELVQKFLDHACLSSEHEIAFHLKCGLVLTERMMKNGQRENAVRLPDTERASRNL